MTSTFDIVEVSLVGIRLHRLSSWIIYIEESIAFLLNINPMHPALQLRFAPLNISPHLNEHDTRLLTSAIQASC